MMGNGRWSSCAAWLGSRSSSSSSAKLLLFMVPLLLVAVIILVMAPYGSNWVVIANQPLLSPSASSSSSSSMVEAPTNVSSSPDEVVKQKEDGLVVVVAVESHGGKGEEKVISDESTTFNHSSTPTPPVEAVQQTPSLSNYSNEETLNVSSKTLPMMMASMNVSYIPVERPRQQRKFSILDKTEAGLIQSRAAIREAIHGNRTQDEDYVPDGPMYHNAKAFHRSYLEMEKKFKVFVYEEGEPPVFHNGPCRSIYSSEGNFINAMDMNEQFRTRDPEKAHVFFLPFSVTMMVRFVYITDSHDFGPIKKTVRDYLSLIAGRYPYWNRSLGADHFMLSCHDWGPMASYSVPDLGKNSIRVLCNANTSEGFKPSKDVSFPEINLRTGSIRGFVGGPSASKRPVLAFFAGGLHGPIRPALLEHWENKDEDMQVHKYLPKGVSYYDMLRKSKFCLCPSGYEVASPRIVEAIYTGCVPVLMSDHYAPPFGDVLNWKSFSIEVSVKDIPRLKEILLSISPRQYIRMQRRVGQIRRHFEVHSPPKRYDMFHMVLHSVWLRRLNFRVHADQ